VSEEFGIFAMPQPPAPPAPRKSAGKP